MRRTALGEGGGHLGGQLSPPNWELTIHGLAIQGTARGGGYHTHTYTIIHADTREDVHTYNRTILGGQVRKSLVLWGTIQIRM